MDKEQIKKLERLGIDSSQCSIDVFDNLLDLCGFLYDELEIKEEDRFKLELYRLSRKATN